MEEFKKKFIEDAKELVSELENNLLALEKKRNDKQIIESVFRGMHTLKGTAGMYGFDNVGKLTHSLENIYDEIRAGKLILDNEILQHSFTGVDLVNFLLNSDDKLNQEMKNEFMIIINFSSTESLENYNSLEEIKLNTNHSTHFFHVLFNPAKETFKRGVNIQATLDELEEIGNYYLHVIKTDLPTLDTIKTDELYLKWEIIISAESKENIEDVFMFFLDDEYTIIELDDISRLNKSKQLKESLDNIYDPKDFSERVNFISEILKKLSVQNEPAKNLSVEEKNREESFNRINQFLTKSSIQDSVRVPSAKLDELMNLVSELVILGSRLELQHELKNYSEMDDLVENLNKISRSFRDNVLNIRLVPLNSIMVRLNRLVHDLAKDLDKKINFVVEGSETELDKTIINNLEGPLMHIIRNCIDHGVESKEDRIKKGKSSEGIVRFIAFYSGTNVFIQVQDDGKGIDPEMIRKTAIEKGFIEANEKLSKKEIYNLIFLPGFTTAKKVTEISGRGVGLDVVRQNIADIRGEIEIDSEIDLGTSVTLKLPLTLSIIDSLLVLISNQPFIIPLSFIDSCEIVSKEKKITKIQNNYEYNGKLIPLVNMSEVLSLPKTDNPKSRITVIQYSDKFYALEVDKIIGEHQAVIKPLGSLFENSHQFSGATILGDGNLAFIIDIIKLVKSY